MKSIRIAISIALLSGWAFSALAAQPGYLKLQTVGFQEKVTVDKDGTKHTDIVPADHVLPGTEVIWKINYEIIGNQPVTDAVITDPIPQHMQYVAGSAAGDRADITFSVDGGNTFATPDKLQVKNPDGSVRTALPKDYTTVRWVLKGTLSPGAKGTVTFHAILQ
ncbi:MAG TPA: hypothetical protein VLV87_09570 [Gammaproteobacteria bacterium]|nr:hypothetical protein [Gammaproteobacteria bacterium]